MIFFEVSENLLYPSFCIVLFPVTAMQPFNDTLWVNSVGVEKTEENNFRLSFYLHHCGVDLPPLEVFGWSKENSKSMKNTSSFFQASHSKFTSIKSSFLSTSVIPSSTDSLTIPSKTASLLSHVLLVLNSTINLNHVSSTITPTVSTSTLQSSAVTPQVINPTHFSKTTFTDGVNKIHVSTITTQSEAVDGVFALKYVDDQGNIHYSEGKDFSIRVSSCTKYSV